MRGVPLLAIRRIHLLKALHVAGQLGGMDHRYIHIVAVLAIRVFSRTVPCVVLLDLNILVLN